MTAPAAGTAARAALLDAVRAHLKVTSRFKVDHARVSGAWAFVRATEVVPLDGGELQETDLTVAALLERVSGGWRVREAWTLPGDDRLPLAGFRRRVAARAASARLPAALFPDDLRPPAGTGKGGAP